MSTNNSNNNQMSNNSNNKPMNNTRIIKQMNGIITKLNEDISALINQQDNNVTIRAFTNALGVLCYHANKRMNLDYTGYDSSYEQPYEQMFNDISDMCERILNKYEEVQRDFDEDLMLTKSTAIELMSGVLNHCNAKVVEHKLIEVQEQEEQENKQESSVDYKKKYEDLLNVFNKKMKEIDESLLNVGRSIDRMEVDMDDVGLSVYNREISIDYIELDKSDVETALGDAQELVEDIQRELNNINEGEEVSNA